MTRVIGIFSGKGGVGKTTAVANIGSSLAHDFGKRVVTIDANTSGSSLGIHLGMQFNPINLNNVLRGEVTEWDALSEHGSGMWVLPASIKLKDYFVDHSKLPEIINKISKRFDIVLVDTAPSMGSETSWTFNAVREGIIVTNPDLPSVIDSLKMAKRISDHNIKILGVVVNRARKDAPMSNLEIEKLLDLPIISEVPEDKSIEKGIKFNVPAVHLYPYSKSSIAFKKLAADLVGEEFETPGFFQIFRRRVGF
jgi:septum site-determining protein MinD